jgi:hypothetical protein
VSSSRFRLTQRSIFVSLLAFLSFGACADVVVGNGSIKTEERHLPAFSSIAVSGSGTLRVHRGHQRVAITSDSNILPYIVTTVSGDQLTIGLKPMASVLDSTKMEFDITIPDLSCVRLSGSGDSYIDAFSGDLFTGTISGSGTMKASLDYTKADLTVSGSGGFDAKVRAVAFDLRCSGSGRVSLEGSAGRIDMAVAGSGRIGAHDFAAQDARIAISGSGDVEVKAEKSIDARLSGSGALQYWGSPSISQQVSGSGRITRAGD